MSEVTSKPKTLKPSRRPRRGQWLKDPQEPRKNELIGGGWFVFHRGDKTGRIRPPEWPFEHATREAAEAEAQRMAKAQPGKIFIVVGAVGTHSFTETSA